MTGRVGNNGALRFLGGESARRCRPKKAAVRNAAAPLRPVGKLRVLHLKTTGCHHGAIHTTPAFASPEGHPAHSTPTHGTTWLAGRSFLLANGVACNGKERNGGGAEGSLDLKHGWRAVVRGRSASIPEAGSGREAVGGRQTPRRAYARTGCERARRQSLVSLWEGGLRQTVCWVSDREPGHWRRCRMRRANQPQNDLNCSSRSRASWHSLVR